jgi:hypothetical protein
MKIYTLIGTMKVDEGTGTLENGRMMYVPTVTTSEKEMRELTDWYDYTCTKWSEITINEEAKEAVKTRVIYTWRDKEIHAFLVSVAFSIMISSSRTFACLLVRLNIGFVSLPICYFDFVKVFQ